MRKYVSLFCVCVALISCIAGNANAENAKKFIGIGTVQRTMGGASVGLPLDSSTALTNPAGMSQTGRRVDLGITYIDADVEYSAHSNIPGIILKDNETIKSDVDAKIIPFFAATLPINNWLTAGIGVIANGLEVNYPERNIYGDAIRVGYRIMKIVPGVSCRINERLSMGIALNLNRVSLEYKIGTPLEPQHSKDSSFGIGAIIGALYNINEYLSAGVSYETKQDFSDFRYNTPLGEDRLALDLPQSLTVGFGIRPHRTLRIATDISWIDWPQTHGQDKPAYTKNSSGSSPWDLSWKEQFVYKVGAEWDAHPKVTLRAGYNYGKHPLKNSRAYENIAVPAIAEHHYGAGMGVHLNERLTVNIGYVYAPGVKFCSSNPSQFIDSSKIKASEKSLEFGIGYRF